MSLDKYGGLKGTLDKSLFYQRVILNSSILSHFGSDTGAVTTGRVYLTPIQIPVTVTIDKIGVICGGTAAGNLRVGIYRDMGDTPLAGALVVESASIAKAGTNRKQEFTVADTQLIAGLYWVAIQSDENTSKFERSDLAWETGGSLIGYYYDRGGGYGAFTTPCPAVSATSQFCLGAYVRVKSIP